jgi:NAD(P)-dependent dehydrogenase (short-subunit alcohol dehydrogenase family)
VSGRLSGRRAIVTGAASGIGAATVKRLAADGAEVIAVDRASVDVAAELATDAGIAAVIAAAGDRLDDTLWQSSFDVNVTAPFKLSRALVPLLAKSPAGRIINTGSILSRYGDANLTAYSASKHAILGLTRALATEVGPLGITVNCIQPGVIVTGMTRPMFDERPESKTYYHSRIPLQRLGQPEDIADVFAFLASDDSRYITGQGIIVDGGVMSHS